MEVLKAALLGLVQGVTEILPVSSDGHLAVVQRLLGTPESSRLALTAALHLGTGLALVFFFARPLARILAGGFSRERSVRRWGWGTIVRLAVATVPAVAAALLLEDRLAALTKSTMVAGVMLAVNGVLLLVSRRAPGHGRALTLMPALLVGIAQVPALLPGISRSGATICVALFLGVTAEEAFEFSFLLAIPATIGAGLFELLKHRGAGFAPQPLAVGIATAFLAGLGALWLLRGLVRQRRLFLFGFYCLVVAGLVLALMR
jgi:undecaprenyl-diphosphatase